MKMNKFDTLRKKIFACTLCSESLPNNPRPIISIGLNSSILIIGQAPGIKAHDSNKPFNDKSGERLRNWLSIDENTFYDKNTISLMPMGFCFPGYKNGADAAPEKTCAPTWHHEVLKYIRPKCTLLVGRYAQKYYIPTEKSLTDAVRKQSLAYKNVWVLPHPSGRNNRWLANCPWFEGEQLTRIKEAVQQALLT